MNNEKGFSLIEMIITVIIVGIVATGFYMMFMTGLSKGADPVQIAQAVEFAQQRIERLIAMKMRLGYTDIALNVGEGTWTALPSPYEKFEEKIDIAYVDSNLVNPTYSGSDTGYKLIQVTVRWGGSYNVRLVAVVTDS
ncbi:MAG: prepilin-type N-terminal cleavage/methylation domain-containing protein [Nitrospirota bacterium]